MSGQGPLRSFVGQDKGRAKFSVTVPRPEPLPHVDRLLAGAARELLAAALGGEPGPEAFRPSSALAH